MVGTQELPADVLDKVLFATSFQTTAGRVVPQALFSASQDIHKSACRTAFASLILPDDGRLLHEATSGCLLPIAYNAISALLTNPARYGEYVQKLYITDPLSYEPVGDGSLETSNLGLFGTFEDEGSDTALATDGEAEDDGHATAVYDPRKLGPIPAHALTALIESCVNLEEFIWASSCPPPDGICEVLVATNQRLHTFSHSPNALSAPVNKSSALKWDALSLPLLSSLTTTLTSLTLTRLSQLGAQSFSLFLSTLEDEELSSMVSLEHLEMHFVWLDDLLCEKVVKALGKKLKSLKIGTHGTKLTDVGVIGLLEGLEGLKDFELSDVQGRLSKALWTKASLDTLSSALRTLKISIPECGPHHSWSLDHLRSLSSFPLNKVNHFAITRTSTSSDEAVLDDALLLQPVPRNILQWLCDTGEELETLSCDWWSWTPDDFKALLEKCTKLQIINVCFDAPFTKLLGLVGTIASASNLRRILVSIPAEHTPSPLPSPSLPTPSNPLSPSGSPYIVTSSSRPGLTPLRSSVGLPSSPTIAKRDGICKTPVYGPPSPNAPHLPHRRSSTISKVSSNGISGGVPEEPTTPTSPCTSLGQTLLLSEGISAQSIPVLDPALPPLRDMKKLFKRSSTLEELTWVGRGTWVREPLARNHPVKTVSLANVKLEFFPSMGISDSEWESRRQREEAVKWNWTPGAVAREGQAWETDAAHILEKEREELCATTLKMKEVNGSIGPTPSSTKRRPSVATESSAPAPTTLAKYAETRRKTPLSSYPASGAQDVTASRSSPRSPVKPNQRKDYRLNRQKATPAPNADGTSDSASSYPRQRTVSTTEGPSTNGRGAGRYHRSASDANSRPLIIGSNGNSNGNRERARSGAGRHSNGITSESVHRYLGSNSRPGGVERTPPEATRMSLPQRI
ncbi:peroxin [Tulasnella sp. JGI-2019a]|nr:peroxin [Tulasnella sp. JGI-2019a]KAG9039819.1 peroxin [Tulasnella sp. JGI-2019a]